MGFPFVQRNPLVPFPDLVEQSVGSHHNLHCEVIFFLSVVGGLESLVFFTSASDRTEKILFVEGK